VRITLLIVLAGIFPVVNVFATDSSGEIRAVMSAQVAAWNRGDIDGFMDGYARSSETEFVSGDKITRGWRTVRDNYRKKYDSREKMGTLKFSEIKITPLSSDAAIVLGRWQLARKKDKPHGTFTLLFRHTRAGWRIVHDHTS
jgi:ketosteroid isomerase-like protein